MIIVGQDKDIILNFENIDMILVGNPLDTDNGEFQIIANTISDNEVRLGCYKTEERAKEVLQEIIKVCKFYKGKTYYVEDEKKLLGKYEYGVYEMPVEKVDDKQ